MFAVQKEIGQQGHWSVSLHKEVICPLVNRKGLDRKQQQENG